MTRPFFKTVLFGGAFDPPHMGHVDCVKLFFQHFDTESFLITPGMVPASSGVSAKTTHAEYRHRLEMCRLAFSEFESDSKSRSKVIISDIEGHLAVPNYTLQTLEALKLSSSQNAALLIGADQLQNFSRWREPLSILKKVSLIVVNRHLSKVDNLCTLKEKANRLLSDLALNAEWIEKECRFIVSQKGFQSIWMIDIPPNPAASTAIREGLAFHNKIPEAWIDKSVLEYISCNRLYRGRES